MTIPFQRQVHRPISRYPLLATLLVAVVALPPSTAFAQQETPENLVSDESADPAEIIETFQLRNADADMVSDVLQTILAGEDGVRMAVGEDNRVIVRGTSATLMKVRETLKVLDQPPLDPSVIKVFSLLHSDASLAARLMEQMIGDVNVAFDARTNSLVVSAPSEIALEKVEVLAQILDQGVDGGRLGISYNLELFWLIESDDDDDDSASTKPVDARIANAAMELERHGFVGAKQVGHLSVIVKPGGEFRVRSNESLGQLQVHGKLDESGDQQLALMLDLAILAENEEIANVMTEFNTRPEHEVVIGIASAQDPDRRSAFVIRVEK